MKPLEGLRVQDLTRVMVALQSDVIVENFRPGVAARLGLGPDLRDEKPGLIYASISGLANPARTPICPPMTLWRRPCRA